MLKTDEPFLFLQHTEETEHISVCISGTYNSQYMVVDLHRISLGHSIKDGALTVVEQIPGKVLYSDQTQALRRGKGQTRLLYIFACFSRFKIFVVLIGRVLAILQHTISC